MRGEEADAGGQIKHRAFLRQERHKCRRVSGREGAMEKAEAGEAGTGEIEAGYSMRRGQCQLWFCAFFLPVLAGIASDSPFAVSVVASDRKRPASDQVVGSVRRQSDVGDQW